MKNLLILDDERVLREAFAAYFEDRQWHPLQAESGEEALKLLKVESLAVVLVDIRLPGMDGDDFIRQACAHQSDLAFVICTGSPEYVLPPDLQASPQVAKHIFHKPVSSLIDLENQMLATIAHLQQEAAQDES